QSLAWFTGQTPERQIAFGARLVTVGKQRQALRRMLELLADDPPADVLEARVNAEFEWVKSIGRGDGMMLVTGYHEPIIDASDVPNNEYRVPIHGVPKEPSGARRGTSLSRTQIEQGRLGSRARPIAWARDPVDVFFLEIEGSGTLRLPGKRE